MAVPEKCGHEGKRQGNHDHNVMEDRHECLKIGEDQQMVGSDYNTRIANMELWE